MDFHPFSVHLHAFPMPPLLRRKTQEDRYTLVPRLDPSLQVTNSFFGVFDGTVGDFASHTVKVWAFCYGEKVLKATFSLWKQAIFKRTAGFREARSGLRGPAGPGGLQVIGVAPLEGLPAQQPSPGRGGTPAFGGVSRHVQLLGCLLTARDDDVRACKDPRIRPCWPSVRAIPRCGVGVMKEPHR